MNMVDNLIKIIPQPPKGIKYMVGHQSWLPKEKQTQRILVTEMWGIRPTIGLCGHVQITAPDGYEDYVELSGIYYWCKLTEGE